MGICKRIPTTTSGDKTARTVNLVNYITTPELSNGDEKCIYSGAMNFLSTTKEGQIAEMISLAQESVHSKDPVDHWMISLHDDEKFSEEQATEAVAIFMRHADLEAHQCIWGVHDDTSNRHIHFAINRVHPYTHKVAKINNGFNKEAGQQAIALIEHAQGWQSEKGARYTITDGQPVMNQKARQIKKERIEGTSTEPIQPTSGERDVEVQTGDKSALRIAQELAIPIVFSANSWEELHKGLNEVGLEYQKNGSGAVILVGDIAIGSSKVFYNRRNGNFSNLQKKLGPFRPSTQMKVLVPDFSNLTQTQINKGVNHVLRQSFDKGIPPDHIIRAEQHRRRAAANRDGSVHELSNGSLDAGRSVIGSVLSDAVQGGVGNQQARKNQDVRRTGTGKTGSGTGKFLNQPLKENQKGWTVYKIFRDEHSKAKELETIEMRKRHDAEKNELKSKHKNQRSELLAGNWTGRGDQRNYRQSAIAIEQASEKLVLQEQHRADRQALRAKYRPISSYKNWLSQPLIMTEIDQPKVQIPALAAMMRSLSRKEEGRHITYSDANGNNLFRDEGRIIKILDLRSDDGIAAALIVAQQKFGTVLTLTGSDAFQRDCVRVAASNKLTCRFADPALEALRLKLQAEERQATFKQSMQPAPAPVMPETVSAQIPAVEERIEVKPEPNVVDKLIAQFQPVREATKEETKHALVVGVSEGMVILSVTTNDAQRNRIKINATYPLRPGQSVHVGRTLTESERDPAQNKGRGIAD